MRLLQPLLLLCFLCPTPGAQEDLQRLAKIEEEWIAARAADLPGLAFEYTSPRRGELIEALLSPTRNRNWERSIAAIEGQLTKINRRRLGPFDGARADALRAALLVERILIDTHASERWHALGYVKRIEHVLRCFDHAASSVQLDARAGAEHYRTLHSILEQLPKYWEASQTNLTAPLLEWNLVAAERLVLINEHIARENARDLTAFGDKDSVAAWKAVGQRAAKSSADFETWLRTAPTRAGTGPSKLGDERWLRLVQAASGSPLDLVKSKWRVLDFIADAEQQFGARWRKPSKAEGMPNPERHLESLPAAANAFLGEAGMLGALLLPSIKAKFQPRESELAPLRSATALRAKGELRLFLDPELKLADRPLLTAIALCEALPMVWFSADRALAQSRAMSEGWALYALDWPLRIDWIENVLQSMPGFPAAVAQLQVIEASRLLAALELHAGQFSPQEATDLFMQRTGLPMARAMREVRAATLDPLYGIGFLAWMELRALEQHLGGGRQGIAACLAKTSAYPALRPRDISDNLKAAEAAK